MPVESPVNDYLLGNHWDDLGAGLASGLDKFFFMPVVAFAIVIEVIIVPIMIVVAIAITMQNHSDACAP